MKLSTYRNAVRVFLANALGLSLALLEGVLVLELAAHDGGWKGGSWVEMALGELSMTRWQ